MAISPQQAAVNAAWMKLWNMRTDNPEYAALRTSLAGTFFTGSDQYAYESPSQTTRDAALSYFGGAPTPASVTATETTPVLGMPNVTPNNYHQVVTYNGGRTVVEKGGTINIPDFRPHPSTTLATNALNALEGAKGGGEGASSVLKAGKGGVDAGSGKTTLSPFQQDVRSAGNTPLANTIRGVGSEMGKTVSFAADIGKGILGTELNIGAHIGGAISGVASNINKAATEYFTGNTQKTGTENINPKTGLPPAPPVPIATGFPYVNQYAPHPKDKITTSDEYMLANYSKAEISTIYALRATALSGNDLPTSIPLAYATSAWGEDGINTMMTSTGIGGQWVIQGQFLVFKPDATTPTPETAGNGTYNGIYQIHDSNPSPSPSSYSPSPSRTLGIVQGFMNLRLASG